MKYLRTHLSTVWFLATCFVSLPTVTAGSLKGTVVIDIPYIELAQNERIDALLLITNTGANPIPYWGRKSDLAIYPEQAVIKWTNRTDGLRTPLGQDEAGLKMNWDHFRNDALSTIPARGTAFFRISSLGKPIYGGAPPRDSIIVEVIVGEDTFLSSDIVDLPTSIEVDPAALPSIATLKWSDGRSELVKKAVIGGEQFLLAVTPETSSARRVARIPTGCDVSVSHDPVLGLHDGVFTQTMTIRFTGGNYEDLVYNWARYQIVSGHQDTVPNAFMRLFNGEVTAEEARKCLEENSRKPWLKSFGRIPFEGDSTSDDGTSRTPRTGALPSVNTTDVTQNLGTSDLQTPSAVVSRAWVVWLATAVAVVGGGLLLFLFIRSRRKS